MRKWAEIDDDGYEILSQKKGCKITLRIFDIENCLRAFKDVVNLLEITISQLLMAFFIRANFSFWGENLRHHISRLYLSSRT